MWWGQRGRRLWVKRHAESHGSPSNRKQPIGTPRFFSAATTSSVWFGGNDATLCTLL